MITEPTQQTLIKFAEDLITKATLQAEAVEDYGQLINELDLFFEQWKNAHGVHHISISSDYDRTYVDSLFLVDTINQKLEEDQLLTSDQTQIDIKQIAKKYLPSFSSIGELELEFTDNSLSVVLTFYDV